MKSVFNKLDPSTLFGSAFGHQMLVKLGAALVLFTIYYVAPMLIRRARSHGDSNQCHGDPDPLIQKVSIVLHLCAFGAGLTAAYLGVRLA